MDADPRPAGPAGDGRAWGTHHGARFDRVNAVTAHLAFMAVSPTSRGQGIGRQLVRAADDIERQRGRRMLTGYVWDDDLALMYER
ncbi:GNAT family N-acetyltransferase [Streptomyces sp. ME02-6987-2C]|uniref:GNAT family N-acetyltransferase n=1 Tax=unclassified Streptomyces TaxID=2593676 RepID=UPI0029BBD944|nr:MULTISPECIES: GNAT family N-acetyltransferase [unclassified Streptomyces]MDX3370123.1 GNAT family N-acetyltransferase [Streptomyces sp. ME02-6987-2C]MDX3426050.1 GNAT family N-acetyltransferase [Streptomyces sp. ME02-6985-2c]